MNARAIGGRLGFQVIAVTASMHAMTFTRPYGVWAHNMFVGVEEAVHGQAAAVAYFETRQGGEDSPPVDLNHLRRFTLGNRDLEREVLQLFADQAPATLRQLQTAVSEKAWRDAAHTLKGSAAAIGAIEVARMAAEAEMLRGDPRAWPGLIERIRGSLGQARAFILLNAAEA